MGENLMSETNRIGYSTLGLVFALVIRKIRSGKGKTKYVLGSVGEREAKVNKEETKTELKQPTNLLP